MRILNGGNSKIQLIYEKDSPAFPNSKKGRFERAGSTSKRLLDIILSIFLIVLFSIPMLFIMAAIKVTSSGPVFFSQKRCGLKGIAIKIYKFRTMFVVEDGDTAVQAKPGDPRITPVGRLLRRFSLDELPQLINVLLGQMSLVGPRPHSIAINEKFRSSINDYMRRYDVKPGLTGWAQIHGYRGHTPTKESMEMRLAHDFWYISNRTVWLDILIILRTVFKIFYDKNAF